MSLAEVTLRSINCAGHRWQKVRETDGLIQVREEDIGFDIQDRRIVGYTWCGIRLPIEPKLHCPNHRHLQRRVARTGSVRKKRLGVQGIDFRVMVERRQIAVMFQRLTEKMTAHDTMRFLALRAKTEQIPSAPAPSTDQPAA